MKQSTLFKQWGKRKKTDSTSGSSTSKKISKPSSSKNLSTLSGPSAERAKIQKRGQGQSSTGAVSFGKGRSKDRVVPAQVARVEPVVSSRPKTTANREFFAHDSAVEVGNYDAVRMLDQLSDEQMHEVDDQLKDDDLLIAALELEKLESDSKRCGKWCTNQSKYQPAANM